MKGIKQAEPELRDGFTLMFFLRAGFGVVILVKALKGAVSLNVAVHKSSPKLTIRKWPFL